MPFAQIGQGIQALDPLNSISEAVECPGGDFAVVIQDLLTTHIVTVGALTPEASPVSINVLTHTNASGGTENISIPLKLPRASITVASFEANGTTPIAGVTVHIVPASDPDEGGDV